MQKNESLTNSLKVFTINLFHVVSVKNNCHIILMRQNSKINIPSYKTLFDNLC